MVESALRHIRILEDCNYPEMKISLKASDPRMMIEAYRMLADQVDYPFHLGVTEAGTPGVGTIKSAVGLRSEEHTSELQSHSDLVCRLLLEKKKNNNHARKEIRDQIKLV